MGNWSVLIVTQQGNCDRAYRYGVSIRSGSVNYDGGVVNFTGRVAANGAVTVRVTSGSAFANGTGRLSRTEGQGRWSRPVRRQPLFRLLDRRTALIAPSRNSAISRPAIAPTAGIRPCVFSQTQLRRPRTSARRDSPYFDTQSEALT